MMSPGPVIGLGLERTVGWRAASSAMGFRFSSLMPTSRRRCGQAQLGDQCGDGVGEGYVRIAHRSGQLALAGGGCRLVPAQDVREHDAT